MQKEVTQREENFGGRKRTHEDIPLSYQKEAATGNIGNGGREFMRYFDFFSQVKIK